MAKLNQQASLSTGLNSELWRNAILSDQAMANVYGGVK